jgi:hypothetical protein
LAAAANAGAPTTPEAQVREQIDGESPEQRFHHEILSAIARIPQLELSEIGDIRRAESMPDQYELVGIKRRVKLWPNSGAGSLPFQSDVDMILRGIINALKSIKADAVSTYPSPINGDLEAQYIRARFNDYTLTFELKVIGYTKTADYVGGEAELNVYIGVLESLLD